MHTMSITRTFSALLLTASVEFCPRNAAAQGISTLGPHEISSLLKTLHFAGSNGSPELTRRLHKRSSVGSPESALLIEIEAEGFQFDSATGNAGAPSRMATFKRPGNLLSDPCSRDARIRWSVDDAKNLTGIDGEHAAICP
jgi:hypothetical protein